MIFYQCGPIDHGTHVTVPCVQSSAEREYNTEFTAGMALANFKMSIHEQLNKDTDIVPEEDPLVVLHSNSAMCMANIGKDTKHNRQIASRMLFVRIG